MPSRRAFLGTAGLLPALRADARRHAPLAARVSTGLAAEEVARDEDYWREVQQAFTVNRAYINLNNGGVSPSPRVVQDAVKRHLDFANEAPAYTMWEVQEPQVESVRRGLAGAFGCDPEELAVTRNASEALEIVQLGMTLRPGDEVLTTNQDYPRMLTTWRQRERRDGIVLRTISIPVPAPSLADIVDRFARAITPRTRVLHFCHITNLTGQIYPVRDLCRLARRQGIETIVDGAHAFGQFPFKQGDLECDYYGTSLHKWLFAPHGTGFLYVRREKIGQIWPLMPAPRSLDTDIRKFEEIGTHPAANHNAIAEALSFQESIGLERKAARLRYLRDRWMNRLSATKGIRVLTSPAPEMSCGIGTFSVEGVDPTVLASSLRDRRILVAPIVHEEFQGIRVTPSLYTTTGEIDIFSDEIARQVAV